MPEQGRDGTTRQRSKKDQPYSDELQQRCMRILELRRARCRSQDTTPPPIPAIDLGKMLRHWPDANRETLRRNVRGLVKYMRDQGAPIASGPGGYWAAETVKDFELTAAFLRGIGLATLATNARLRRAVALGRAQGQTLIAPYHTLISGRSGLALYLSQGESPAPPLATPRQGADHQVAAPQVNEQSDQTWSDSLFGPA